MNATWTHNGFHGRAMIRVRVPDGSVPGKTVTVSAGVARRLNRLVCGMSDCKCGEAVAGYDMQSGQHYVTIPDGGEHRGNYPQGD